MSEWPPIPSTLQGPTVTLEPLERDHVGDLQAAAESGRLWETPYAFVPHPDGMAGYVDQALREAEQRTSLPYVVRLNKEDRVIGTTRFRNIPPQRRRMEIGFTWYSESHQRSSVNTECKLLLLGHAFDDLSCIAIEWFVHSLNFRSREAVLKLGAKFDGTMRNFFVMPDGTMVDLALYSVINSEWPTIKAHLIARAERLRRHHRSTQ